MVRCKQPRARPPMMSASRGMPPKFKPGLASTKEAAYHSGDAARVRGVRRLVPAEGVDFRRRGGLVRLCTTFLSAPAVEAAGHLINVAGDAFLGQGFLESGAQGVAVGVASEDWR